MKNRDRIHFHWRLIQGGEGNISTFATQNDNHQAGSPDMKLQVEFCQTAEKLGIESVLVDLSYGKPDPILLVTALSRSTEKLGFIIAVRSGLLSPTLFAQQINTLSHISKGRIYLNVVAGHSPAEQKIYGDFLDHDGRYARTDDFSDVCTRFWDGHAPVNVKGRYIQIEGGRLTVPYLSNGKDRPFIFIAGGSQPTIDLTRKYGDCWMQLGEVPDRLKEKIGLVVAAGKAAGLRFSMICRETHEEALEAAWHLKQETSKDQGRLEKVIAKSDSVSIRRNHQLAGEEWPGANIWAGAVKTVGPTGIALVGSYDDIAQQIMDYKEIGVTHFIFSGWPKLEEMVRFGTHVIPRVREIEQRKFKEDKHYA